MPDDEKKQEAPPPAEEPKNDAPAPQVLAQPPAPAPAPAPVRAAAAEADTVAVPRAEWEAMKSAVAGIPDSIAKAVAEHTGILTPLIDAIRDVTDEEVKPGIEKGNRVRKALKSKLF